MIRITTRALLVAGVSLIAMPVAAQTPSTSTATPPAADQTGGQTPATAAQATENAAADTPAAAGDVIVTARRRAESLQRVPIAVTAFTADKLEKAGAIDLTDLQNTTPNTTFKDARGTNSTLAAFIRGVGQQDPVPGFESGVGIYLDDVYLNRPQAAVLDIYDVDRIEVLRGPQGTLYGRNTIGGAVKYVTKRLPDEPTTSLKATYGSYNEADGVISASLPLGDMLRVGVAGARFSHDGFGRNTNLRFDNYNKDEWAFRGTAEFETPDTRLFVRLTADYTDDRSNPRNGHRLIPGLLDGTPVLSNLYDTNAGLNNPHENVQAGGGSLAVTAKLTDALTLRSISAYRQDRSYTPIDFDSTPLVDVDVPAVYRNSQTSQEFQLLYASDKLNGLVGYYYLGAKASTGFDVLLYTTGNAVPPGPPAFGPYPQLDAYTAGDVRTETSSVYADFTYDFLPQLSLSLGGRYTWDQRRSTIVKQNYINGPTSEFGGNPTVFGNPATNFTGTANFRRFTPRASLDFKPSADHLIYASYSEGFKGGGFDPRGSGASAPDTNGDGVRSYQEIYNYLRFKPETVDSYELGWKGALFDRQITFALDGFYADYHDVQVPGSVGATVNGVQTFIGITTNAAKAHFKGVEFEGNASVARGYAGPGSAVTFSTSVGYIDAKYDNYIGPTGVDISAVSAFQNTPKWTASGTLGTALGLGGGQLSASSTVSYRSLTHQFQTPSVLLDQPAYTLVDANLVYSFAHNRYSIGVHGKNLTDKHYIIGGYQYLKADLAGNLLNASGQIITNGQGYVPTLGKEGIATAFYGNPRQVLGTFTARF